MEEESTRRNSKCERVQLNGMGLPADIKKPTGLGARHGQALLLFFALILTYALRVNLSVGIVAMTDEKGLGPVISFNSAEKGAVLSAFFWTYIVLQVPAGVMARRYGPCRLLAASVGISAVITMLIPWATATGGWIALCIMRAMMGICQGAIYPSVTTHISRWSTNAERARVYAFIFGGGQMGSIIMLISGGIICEKAGWAFTFYIPGIAAIVWTGFCILYGSDSPTKHKTISNEERDYLEANISNMSSNLKMATPWKSIVTSVPMWAVLAAYLANAWGFWTLLTLTPSYINGVLKFDLQGNGLLSSLPYMAMWAMTIVFPLINKTINDRGWLELTAQRKFWNSIAQYGPAISLVVLAYAPVNATSAIALLVISNAFSGASFIGFCLSTLDLSPNHVGTLTGINNGLSNITAILGPLISSYIVTDQSDASQWKIVFLLAALVLFTGNTIYILWSTAEVQPWNDIQKSKKQSVNLATSKNESHVPIRSNADELC